jgi:hypothetical protein
MEPQNVPSNESSGPAPATPGVESSHLAARRRFMKAGLAGGAIVVTLQSRRLWAQTCDSPSAQASTALSGCPQP